MTRIGLGENGRKLIVSSSSSHKIISDLPSLKISNHWLLVQVQEEGTRDTP